MSTPGVATAKSTGICGETWPSRFVKSGVMPGPGGGPSRRPTRRPRSTGSRTRRPERIRALQRLADEHRPLSAGRLVDPVRRCRQRAAERLGDRVRRVRRGDLAGQVPRETSAATCRRRRSRRVGAAPRRPAAQQVGREPGDDRERRGSRTAGASVGVREVPRAVQPLEDREAERVGVEVLVRVVGRRRDQVRGTRPSRAPSGTSRNRPAMNHRAATVKTTGRRR